MLDEKLNFKQHIGSAISKVNKGISVIKRLRHKKTFATEIISYNLRSIFQASN